MSKFKELNDYINKVATSLLNNQNICKLLYYTDKDPLAKEDIEDTITLFNNNIFPFNYVPSEDKKTCIISIVLDDFSNDGGIHFRKGNISFNIICHKDLWQTESGLRPFLIMEEIDTMFNKVHYKNLDYAKIGIGGLVFEDAHALWNSNIYSGYQVTYRTLDMA